MLQERPLHLGAERSERVLGWMTHPELARAIWDHLHGVPLDQRESA